MRAPLIEAAELSALLASRPHDLVVCDCRFDLADPEAGAAAYAAGHIPGGFYVNLETVLSGPKTGLNGRHPLPDRQALAGHIAALGAGADSLLVAYDAADAMFAARLWWLLRWLGHANTAVLNGGLAAWRAAGFATENTAPPPPRRGSFTEQPALTATIGYAELSAGARAAVGDRLVVDARAPDRFRGEIEPLDAAAGHIPGARNHFFRGNLDAAGRFKPAAALRADFLTVLAGRQATELVASCGSGVTACHNLLAMEIAGLPGGVLYPGSWSEWSAQPDAPVARGNPS